jgi:hypothetical protein
MFILSPALASAQDSPQALRQEIDQLRRDFEALKQQYGDRLAALEGKLASTEGAPPAAAPAAAAPDAPQAQQPAPPPPPVQVPPGAEGAGGPTGSLPVYGGAAAGSKIFNPDITVVGNFLGAAGRNVEQPSPALEMHESEASFQAIVDPYGRADFFFAFGEEGVELEEGYLTLTTLPGGWLTKVGKMKEAFGKVNTMHSHQLPWTDRPLVSQNLVGGEEGLADAGISVSNLIPNPWLFLEATGQIYRGDSGLEEQPVFVSGKPGNVSYLGHLRAYRDITEDTNIDLGVSYARGHNDADPENIGLLHTDLFGVDATFRWKPLQRSIYRSFVGRAEWIRSQREQPSFIAPQERGRNRREPTIERELADGFYVSGEYQLARRWSLGARFDRSGQATDGSLVDTGGSLLLTFWPSEFSQVRGQYRRTNYALGEPANEFLFQFMFTIGAHGAHPF